MYVELSNMHKGRSQKLRLSCWNAQNKVAILLLQDSKVKQYLRITLNLRYGRTTKIS
jgi:hypothetical protein